MKTALVVPKSASEFHKTYFPSFQFDRTDVVPDVGDGRVATADAVVDRSLAWLRRERPDRFLLWVYQYDVHGWVDLPEDAAPDPGSAAPTPPPAHPPRYRAAARRVDRAFARLRSGLAELGLAERTIVVFLSDHGESLGQQNFWAHTTYLWESLVRVPLAIRVPGAEPRFVTRPVSTIDVLPTVARWLGRPDGPVRCDGEDLLAVRESAPERRVPILFSAIVDGSLVRVGLLDHASRKLVLDVRDGDARLFRIEDGGGEVDVSAGEPEAWRHAVEALVRAPIYPRTGAKVR